MTAHLRTGASWHAISTVYVKVGGVWKTVSDAYVKIAGTWHPFIGSGGGAALSVSQSVSTVSGSRSDAGSVTSSAALGIVSNGTAPYTYAWSKVSGDTLTITSPTAISTTFSTTLTNGQMKSAIYKLTVTDNVGAIASANVTVNMTSTYVAPPPPPEPPNWDFAVDDHDNGDGTRTIFWGIIGVTYAVGPVSYSPAASGSFTVGSADHGLFFATVTDDGNGASSSGAFSY